MITGANTNVRHRGIVFHVQTEDSGRANPHVISHLYHHGTILASNKTEYSEHLELDSEALEGVVRGLIETQHGKMLAGLKGGEFDAVIQERLNPDGANTASDDDDQATDGQITGLETPTPMPEVGASAGEESAEPAVNPRAFGEGIVSQKPLDEVILEYLADKARDRAADRTGKSAQKSRSSG